MQRYTLLVLVTFLLTAGGPEPGPLFAILPATAHAATVQLPRTGQTGCWDQAGNLIDCLNTGQDGEIQSGVIWPASRFVDNGDQSQTDTLTGLIWTKNAWPAGITHTWPEALAYIKTLNNQVYLGHNDWRLPSINELRSLLVAQPNVITWLTAQGFANVQPLGYWSSTSFVPYDQFAWILNLNGPGTINNPKDFYGMNKVNVWPVRGDQGGVVAVAATGQTACYDASGALIDCAGTGQDGETQLGAAWPNPRFEAAGDTVRDNLTGLVWGKDGATAGPVGCSPGVSKTWQAALDHVQCLNQNGWLGRYDWRLPNRDELASLTNLQEQSQADWLNANGFVNIQPGEYWTSTSYGGSPTMLAWTVSLHFATVGSLRKTDTAHLLPVCGGIVPKTTLAVLLGGTGSGNVTSTPSGIACVSGPCLVSFVTGSLVLLTATADENSIFTGWGDACAGTAPCTVSLEAAQKATAVFGLLDFVRIDQSSYGTLGSAYRHALVGNTIRAQGLTFVEDLDLNRDINITLRGGYDRGFLQQEGMSTIHGMLTLSGSGSVTVDRLVVR